MQVKSAEFLVSATRPGNWPQHAYPEIAFAGRSNVGKSSLINCLVQRKSLVRTSSTPGRTQLLNFFLVNSRFCLVDLPGYGFAKAPKAVREAWGPMMQTYLRERSNLCGVVLLFDVRRVPRDEDLQMLDWLEEGGVPTIPVITKIDKVSRNRRAASISPILEATGLPADAFTFFSTLSGEGVADLWERMSVVLDESGTEGEGEE